MIERYPPINLEMCSIHKTNLSKQSIEVTNPKYKKGNTTTTTKPQIMKFLNRLRFL